MLLRELKGLVPTISARFVEATSPFILAADRTRLVEGLARAGLP